MALSSASPSTVLAAYLERFIEGRRVIVFGSAASGLAAHLIDRGARLVHVYDTDLGRVAEATARGTSQDVTFAPLGGHGIAVRDGAFDVGIIENLARYEDQADVIRRMRRALAARGILLVASPNPDAAAPLLPSEPGTPPSYYELFDLVSAEFDEVAMLGQAPFVGYAVASFSANDDDEFSIDTGFVSGGAEEPDWYLALASHFALGVDAFCVVQLGLADYRGAAAARGDGALVDRMRKRAIVAEENAARLQEELKARTADEARAQAELDRLRRELADSQSAAQKKRLEPQASQGEVQKLQARLQALEAQLTVAHEELRERNSWVDELEARAVTADARADAAEEALEQDRRNRVSELPVPQEGKPSTEAPEQTAALELELQSLRTSSQSMAIQLKEQAELLRQARNAYHDLERDCSALETQLGERASHVAALQAALERAERLASELLALRSASEAPEPDEASTADDTVLALREQVELLAAANARRLADLQAAQWTIEELSETTPPN